MVKYYKKFWYWNEIKTLPFLRGFFFGCRKWGMNAKNVAFNWISKILSYLLQRLVGPYVQIMVVLSSLFDYRSWTGLRGRKGRWGGGCKLGHFSSLFFNSVHSESKTTNTSIWDWTIILKCFTLWKTYCRSIFHLGSSERVIMFDRKVETTEIEKKSLC